MSKVYLAYGINGTGKTTWAVSGEGLIKYAELDAGSLDRAFAIGNVDKTEFYAPLTALTDLGALGLSMLGESGKGAVQVVHRYTGWQEKYGEFVRWYMDCLRNPEVQYIVIDTATKLWLMSRNALRERIQDTVPKEQQGDRLKRLEYEAPNSEFHAVVEASKANKKNLVFVAHEGEVWSGDKPTGRPKPDGWSEIQDEADVILRFTIKDRRPVGMLKKGDLDLVDKEIKEPTMAGITALLDAANKIRRAGGSVPEDPEMVIQTAMFA